MKICTACNRELPDDSFGWNTHRGIRSRRSQCRACHVQRTSEYLMEHQPLPVIADWHRELRSL